MLQHGELTQARDGSNSPTDRRLSRRRCRRRRRTLPSSVSSSSFVAVFLSVSWATMTSLMFACTLAATLLAMSAARAAAELSVLECDVVVAGGSTAGLSAAIAAATQVGDRQSQAERREAYRAGRTLTPGLDGFAPQGGPELRVCFFEPTDWPGGQLTASAVSAVDFGPSNQNASTWSRNFASVVQRRSSSITAAAHTPTTRVGNCLL